MNRAASRDRPSVAAPDLSSIGREDRQVTGGPRDPDLARRETARTPWSSALVVVPLQADPILPADLFGYPSSWVLVGIALLGLVLGVLLRISRERWSAVRFGSQVRKLTSERATDAGAPPGGRDFLRSDQTSVTRHKTEVTALNEAEAHRQAGDHDEAVQAAYHAVRQELGGLFDIPSGVTHWEFYRTCEEVPLGDPLDDLFELTTLYEQAAYDIPPVDSSEADRALDAARVVLRLIPATPSGESGQSRSDDPDSEGLMDP